MFLGLNYSNLRANILKSPEFFSQQGCCTLPPVLIYTLSPPVASIPHFHSGPTSNSRARTKIKTRRMEDIYHHPKNLPTRISEYPPLPPSQPNSNDQFSNVPISQINPKFPESSIIKKKKKQQRVKGGDIWEGRDGMRQQGRGSSSNCKTSKRWNGVDRKYPNWQGRVEDMGNN